MISRPPSTPMILVGVIAALLLGVGAPDQAQAAFNGSVAASTTVSSATLAAPTGVTLSATCGLVLATTPYMTATWTATASTFATGYKVTPVLNGSAQTPVSVSGPSTTTVNVNITRSSLGVTDKVWTFTIVAVDNNWTSTSVSPTPATTSCPFL